MGDDKDQVIKCNTWFKGEWCPTCNPLLFCPEHGYKRGGICPKCTKCTKCSASLVNGKYPCLKGCDECQVPEHKGVIFRMGGECPKCARRRRLGWKPSHDIPRRREGFHPLINPFGRTSASPEI